MVTLKSFIIPRFSTKIPIVFIEELGESSFGVWADNLMPTSLNLGSTSADENTKPFEGDLEETGWNPLAITRSILLVSANQELILKAVSKSGAGA
jgi:hypothetical protein